MAQYLSTVSRSTMWEWGPARSRLVANLIHSGLVTDVAVSPTGQYCATANGGEFRVPVWKADLFNRGLDSGKVQDLSVMEQNLKADISHWANKVAFSSDGRYLVTAGQDTATHVWDLESSSNRVSIESAVLTPPHAAPVCAAQFSPDGRRIATVIENGTTQVWSFAGEKVCEIDRVGPVQDLAFSPDGEYLAIAGADGGARLWQFSAGKFVSQMYHESPVRAVAFSSNGLFLATGGLRQYGARVGDPERPGGRAPPP
jgi:WD40 repeat protein